MEAFIQQVQSGAVDTSTAMNAYRNLHRPTIAKLESELQRFRALLDTSREAEDDGVPF